MTSPQTGAGSPARNAMRRRNRAVYAECRRLRRVGAIRRYRESLVPQPLRDEVAEHAERIGRRLGQSVAA